jgi:hypothetical protein
MPVKYGENPPGPSDERAMSADAWEASADERERLADERELLAREREGLADQRERLADRHDRDLDRREADLDRLMASAGDVNEAAEIAATQAALRRAQAGVRRAEAELLRAQQSASRVEARAALRSAASERTAAARYAQEAVEVDDRAWLADRRDFIAAEREKLADERDTLSDQHDEMAALRERLADDREHESLNRERGIDHRRRTGHRDSEARPPAGDERLQAELRAIGENRRLKAAESRRTAAQDRARAAASWGPQAYGPMLVASFSDLARELFASEDLTEALPQVLKFAVGTIAGCDCASITLWRHERVIRTVTSNAVAAELDDIQFGTGLGPALDALRSDGPVYVPNLADSQQWPVFGATAAQLGVASALCHGMFVRQPAQWSVLGTFSLYGATADAFSDEDQEFCSILAAYAAVAVAVARRRDEVDRREAALHRGLSSRDIIGQAKGILMERQRLSAGEAFDLLRRASQLLNRKLTDVARDLAETGELPNTISGHEA